MNEHQSFRLAEAVQKLLSPGRVCVVYRESHPPALPNVCKLKTVRQLAHRLHARELLGLYGLYVIFDKHLIYMM